MSKRTFDGDCGVVGEISTFGSLMPVMEGRRSDIARFKQLNKNGLAVRIRQLNKLYSSVCEEWTAVYGIPSEKKVAAEALSNRPTTNLPTYEEVCRSLSLMVHAYHSKTTQDGLRYIGLSGGCTMFPDGKPMHTDEACEILARVKEHGGNDHEAKIARSLKTSQPSTN